MLEYKVKKFLLACIIERDRIKTFNYSIESPAFYKEKAIVDLPNKSYSIKNKEVIVKIFYISNNRLYDSYCRGQINIFIVKCGSLKKHLTYAKADLELMVKEICFYANSF